MPHLDDIFTLEIPINTPNITAIHHLSQHCQATARILSKQQLKNAMAKGAVWLQRGNSTSRLRRAKRELMIGDQLFLYYNESVLRGDVLPAELIADMGTYSVWNKPSGMLSHGSKWGDHCAITRWVELHHTPQRDSFLIHRLDRAASGLILIAHDKKTAAALCQLFEKRCIKKYYQAVVHGQYREGQNSRDDSTLSSKAKPTHLITTPIDDKAAISKVTPVHYCPISHQSLVKVAIETGRKHQIRRHLSGSGHPIVGDRLYGTVEETSKDLQLRAYHLSFCCPLSQKQRSLTLNDNQLLSLRT